MITMGSPYYSSYGYNNSNYADYYNKYYGNYYANSYGYNYGNGQPQTTSVLGNTSMSMANSSIGAAPELWSSNASAATENVSETYRKAMEGKSEGGGGNFFGDFFKGIVKGFENLIKSLTDPKTLLLMAGMIALCIMFPPLGTALMWIGGGLAAMQVMQGVASGNGEQAGEGAFNLGLAVIGGKSAASAGTKAKNAAFAGKSGAQSGVQSASAGKNAGMFAKAKTGMKNWYNRHFGHAPSHTSKAKASMKQASDKLDDLAVQEKALLKQKSELEGVKNTRDLTPDESTNLTKVTSQLDDVAQQKTVARKQLDEARKLRTQEHTDYRNNEKARQREQDLANKTQEKGAKAQKKDTETAEPPSQLQTKAKAKAEELKSAQNKKVEAETKATKAKQEYETLRQKQAEFDAQSVKATQKLNTSYMKMNRAKSEYTRLQDEVRALKDQGKLDSVQTKEYGAKLSKAKREWELAKTEHKTAFEKKADLGSNPYTDKVNVAKTQMDDAVKLSDEAGTNVTKLDSEVNFAKGQADEAFRVDMTKGSNPKTRAKKAEQTAEQTRTKATEAQQHADDMKAKHGQDSEAYKSAQTEADDLARMAKEQEAYAQMAADKADEMAKFGMWNKFKAAPWQYTFAGATQSHTVSGPIFGMLGGGSQNSEGGGLLSGLVG
jgi:hypothetical protein